MTSHFAGGTLTSYSSKLSPENFYSRPGGFTCI